MYALNPRLNVRIFPAGIQDSVDAAEAWAFDPIGKHARAWNVLTEELDAELPLPGVGPDVWIRQRNPGGRAWISAGRGELGSFLSGDPEFDQELGHAWGAYHTHREDPPRPLVMGVLNVTPDSFSDGGQWIDADRAVERGLAMIEEGADVLDIGGESTRPGAAEVPAEEELRRILPVVTKLRAAATVPLSIDTRKAAVARPCLDAGADWINDVSGLTFDPALADLAAARRDVKLVLMHSRAKPAEEVYSTEWGASGPRYADVVADTLAWLRRQACLALERGVRPEQLWMDPGFGFGKTYEQNLDLLRRLREYTSAGLPVLIGTSRKSSVGRMVGDLPPDQRLEGTAATVAWAVEHGAAAVRVHEVREMSRVVRATHALVSPPKAGVQEAENST